LNLVSKCPPSPNSSTNDKTSVEKPIKRMQTSKPERRKLCAQRRLDNINREWQKEVIDKKNGNTYRSAMTAPTASAALQSRDERTGEGAVANEGIDEVADRQFYKACQNYGHQRRSSRLCLKNKKSKYYEGKTVESYRKGNTIEKLWPMYSYLANL
jgi:ribosomal protein L32